MVKFKRVCLSLDQESYDLLSRLSSEHKMNNSTFIKFLLLRYYTTYCFTTPWLRGKV